MTIPPPIPVPSVIPTRRFAPRPRPPPPFAVGRAVGVVVQRDRESRRLGDQVRERRVAPPQVRGFPHHARPAVQRPRTAHADPRHHPAPPASATALSSMAATLAARCAGPRSGTVRSRLTTSGTRPSKGTRPTRRFVPPDVHAGDPARRPGPPRPALPAPRTPGAPVAPPAGRAHRFPASRAPVGRIVPRLSHKRSPSSCNTAMNASCGISTDPTCFMRFFPSFWRSRSLRLRVMSPP